MNGVNFMKEENIMQRLNQAVFFALVFTIGLSIDTYSIAGEYHDNFDTYENMLRYVILLHTVQS